MCSDVISVVNKFIIIIVLRGGVFPGAAFTALFHLSPLLDDFSFGCWRIMRLLRYCRVGDWLSVVPFGRDMSLKSVPTKGPVRRFMNVFFPNLLNRAGFAGGSNF